MSFYDIKKVLLYDVKMVLLYNINIKGVTMLGNYQAFEFSTVARYRSHSADGRVTAALISCSLRNS